MEKTFRKLTVGEKPPAGVTRRHPCIKLSGKWLWEAGFYEGDEIIVTIEFEKLTIVRVREYTMTIRPTAA